MFEGVVIQSFVINISLIDHPKEKYEIIVTPSLKSELMLVASENRVTLKLSATPNNLDSQI